MTAERNAEIRRLAAAEKTFSEIAAELGLTRSVVAGVLSRSGGTGRLAKKKSERDGVAIGARPEPAPLRRSNGIGGSGCRFPLWPHDAKPDGRFCGKEVDGAGRPYCAKHSAICFNTAASRLTAPSEGGSPKQGVGLRAGLVDA